MLKKNKWILVITTMLILLPIAAGLYLWEQLPDVIATHWGVNGEPDGWSKKWVAVFGLPLLLCAIQWAGAFATEWDKSSKKQNRKVKAMVLWIIPVVSIVGSGYVYAAAMGKTLNIAAVVLPLLGLLFVTVGNYLPKCTQSYTVGIKLKWTLEDEANWHATHRLAGKLWVAGGVLMMIGAFLPQAAAPWLTAAAVAVMVLVPGAYSYIYSRKNK